jgi:hypothetical protein
MLTKTKTEFTPTAVLITSDAEFQDAGRTAVDPELVTLLHLDSVNNCGWLFTREEWEQDREPRIYRRFGEHEGLQEGERVELLPDMWIVKIDETNHWAASIQSKVQRIFGVYCFDRRQHTHCCSLTPSYWLTFLGSQWSPNSELNDEQCEELAGQIQEGERGGEYDSYFDVAAVDRMVANKCREHFLPFEKSGGFKVEGIKSVVTDDAVVEIQEAYQGSEL